MTIEYRACRVEDLILSAVEAAGSPGWMLGINRRDLQRAILVSLSSGVVVSTSPLSVERIECVAGCGQRRAPGRRPFKKANSGFDRPTTLVAPDVTACASLSIASGRLENASRRRRSSKPCVK